MSEHLKELFEAARNAPQMTELEKENQRRSFAFGNANIENERVTRELINEVAERIQR